MCWWVCGVDGYLNELDVFLLVVVFVVIVLLFFGFRVFFVCLWCLIFVFLLVKLVRKVCELGKLILIMKCSIV